MVSWLFVLFIVCSIAYAVLGVDSQHETKLLSNLKTFKKYSTTSVDTPTAKPTARAKASPTAKPVVSPTAEPVIEPTADPIVDPTTAPTFVPTEQPIAEPTDQPVANPTVAPTFIPTEQPIAEPTDQPVANPTVAPTFVPTEQPIAEPTDQPVANPTVAPTFVPTEQPIAEPTDQPVANPTAAPNSVPTKQPIVVPTYVPTFKPSEFPSIKPVALPTAAPTHRQISCKVVMIIIRIAIWWYRHNPHGCNSVLKAAIVAAIRGLAIGDIQDPLVSEAILAVENGHLRVSVQDEVPEGISVEYTINVNADSGLTYEDISTQLVNSVESNQFTTLLNQYAVEQNVTQFTSVSAMSIQTTDVTVNTDIASRSSGDALGSDAIVGIAIGFCALLFLSAYLGRLYVARRAARSNSVETAEKFPLTAELSSTNSQSTGWTDNPLGGSSATSVTVA